MIFLIFGGIILLASFILACKNDEKYKTDKGFAVWASAFLGTVFVGLAISVHEPKAISVHEPKAIDVYRGKTELKVKSVMENDSTLKVDSVVIFKK